MNIRTIIGVLALTVVIAAIPVELYLNELRSSVTKYYTFYGTLTTADSFTYPDYIELNAFGTAPEPQDLDFVTRLVCAPLNEDGSKNYDREKTVGRFYATRTHFAFSDQQTLPASAQILFDQGRTLANIDTELRDSLSHEDPSYRTPWFYGIKNDGHDEVNMVGQDRPIDSSWCYIQTEAKALTPLFKLPKITNVVSNSFYYYNKDRISE